MKRLSPALAPATTSASLCPEPSLNLKKAAQERLIEKYGLGAGYRTLAGTHAMHVELEEKIARFKGTEGAVTFTSAYAAPH